MQLYPLVSSKKKKELEASFNKQEMKKVALANQENNPLISKYIEILSVPRKKEQIVKLMKSEFWQYFANFAELAEKTLPKKVNKDKKIEMDKKKWINIPEKEIYIWTNLGYSPEDTTDPTNHILKNMNISKLIKEQWEKQNAKLEKDENDNLTIKLEKWVELRRKNALAKLKKESKIER